MSNLVRYARMVASAVLEVLNDDYVEEARINVTKPYKRRRLKMDPISTMRRRLYKLTTRDPKITRKRKLYQKLYRRKNKQALERREDYVEKVKKNLPPPPGRVNPKRSSKSN